MEKPRGKGKPGTNFHKENGQASNTDDGWEEKRGSLCPPLWGAAGVMICIMFASRDGEVPRQKSSWSELTSCEGVSQNDHREGGNLCKGHSDRNVRFHRPAQCTEIHGCGSFILYINQQSLRATPTAISLHTHLQALLKPCLEASSCLICCPLSCPTVSRIKEQGGESRLP